MRILLEISGALWQNVYLESSAGSSIMAEIVSFRKDAAGAEEGSLLTRSLRDGVLRLVLNNPPANVLRSHFSKR